MVPHFHCRKKGWQKKLDLLSQTHTFRWSIIFFWSQSQTFSTCHVCVPLILYGKWETFFYIWLTYLLVLQLTVGHEMWGKWSVKEKGEKKFIDTWKAIAEFNLFFCYLSVRLYLCRCHCYYPYTLYKAFICFLFYWGFVGNVGSCCSLSCFLLLGNKS